MHAAWLLVVLAQAPVETTSVATGLSGAAVSSTSSITPAPLLDDLPLTDEELALLDSIEATTTASASKPRRIELAPALRVPEHRLQGRVARSLGEALREEATVFSVSRRFVTGESPVARGRGGQRIQTTMDGLELRHALDSIDRSTTLGFIDPWVVESVALSSTPDLAIGGFGGHGAIEIEGRKPRREPGLRTELRGLGRLADRSTGFRGLAETGLGPAALTVAGGYSDHDPMRDGVGRQLPGTGDEESSLLSRARLLGRERDPFELDLGFDLFRITNAQRFDLDERIDRLRSLVSGFGRLRSQFGNTELSVLAGARRFESSTEPRGGGERSTDAADVMQADVRLRHQLSETLALSAFGDVYTSGAHGTVVRGRMLRASGGASAELALEPLSLRAAVRGGFARSHDELDKTSEGAFVLPELRLGLALIDPLSFLVSYEEAVHAPTVLDLSSARSTVALEHTRTVELALAYASNLFDARAGAFTTIVSNPIETSAAEVSNRPTLVLLGGELVGALRPVPGLELALALSITRGLGDERASFVEGSTGAARIRYELGVRNAYVEAAVRHVIVFPGVASNEDDLNRRRSWSLPYASLGGGLDLGLGFALSVLVANALDVDERELVSDIPRPGVDLRLALEHRFEL